MSFTEVPIGFGITLFLQVESVFPQLFWCFAELRDVLGQEPHTALIDVGPANHNSTPA